MRADVAQTGRAEQGVDYGVPEDIAVGVAGLALGMSKVNAAEHEPAPFDQRVDVPALPDAECDGPFHRQIFPVGDFAVFPVAWNPGDLTDVAVPELGVVGGGPALGGGCRVDLFEYAEREALGRLGRHDGVAARVRLDETVGADGFRRVGQVGQRKAGAALPRRGEDGFDRAG